MHAMRLWLELTAVEVLYSHRHAVLSMGVHLCQCPMPMLLRLGLGQRLVSSGLG